MTRLPDWDRRLVAVSEKHMRLPGVWGVSDCWMFAMDAVEAVTGTRVLGQLQRYRSEAAGYRAFARKGFATVEDALAATFPTVGRLLAQRGDLGVVERNGLISCGVFVADGFAVKTLYGEGRTVTHAEFSILPVTDVKTAFMVGRN